MQYFRLDLKSAKTFLSNDFTTKLQFMDCPFEIIDHDNMITQFDESVKDKR